MRQDVQRSTNAAVLAIAISVALTAVATQSQAQTFKVIHDFTGVGGAHPLAGLVIDGQGNLYGTTAWGGDSNNGTAFELKHTKSGFVFGVLHSFGGGSDGQFPAAPVVIGADGRLYGTTPIGGSLSGGMVYSLSKPARCVGVCSWTKKVVHQFTGGSSDGRGPWAKVVFDKAGNLYGTTAYGGSADQGVVYELKPSNGAWKGHVLYSFTGGQDGDSPLAGVTFDNAGNLYGTANAGGNPVCQFGCGTVYELVPSGAGWKEHTLYEFNDGVDGSAPQAGVIIDGSGNLYGATPGGGNAGVGEVFELTPSTGNWTFSVLESFTRRSGLGPLSDLVMDKAGSLYGTTGEDGIYGGGSVFKLTPTKNGWTYTDLHDFTPSVDGGATAQGGLVIDSNGNLYGTTYTDGTNRLGVVFEITP
jgi:uncharacterized repeat protein (TIGR03803 family)